MKRFCPALLFLLCFLPLTVPAASLDPDDMAFNDPKRLLDGSPAGFEGGQNVARVPSALPENQFARGINVACRGGILTCRPGARQLTFTFAPVQSPIPPDTAANQENFYTGIFQGAATYQLGSSYAIIVSVSGRLYSLAPNGDNAFVITDITPGDGPNDPNVQIVYFCQAGTFLIVQDGIHLPIILENTETLGGSSLDPGNSFSIRRSDPFDRASDPTVAPYKNGIPIGTVMAFAQGRLFVVRNKKIFAGDLYNTEFYDNATPPGLISPADQALVRFTEVKYLSEGLPLAVPYGFGRVQFMTALPVQDTATGQGQLYVAAEHGIAAFNVGAARSTWKDIVFQTIALMDIGGTGSRNWTLVNNDLWFRAPDGWRSFRQARAEQGGWQHLPQSLAVGDLIVADPLSALNRGSAISFDNRLLVTISPNINGVGRWWHNGILSLDFAPLSNGAAALSVAAPAWDGAWYVPGVRPLQWVKAPNYNGERALLFGLDGNDRTTLVELTRGERFDFGTQPISWTVETRAETFGLPFSEKTLITADFWLENRLGNTAFAVDYQPDAYFDWLPWFSKADSAPTGNPPRYDPRLRLPAPPEFVDTVAKRRSDNFYDVQLRLRVSGSLSVLRYRLHARSLSEESGGDGTPQ